jgi:hypothetical protein
MMYTIVRFTAGVEVMGTLTNLGRSMNSLRPGIFTGIRKQGDGFSCEVCTESSGDIHVTEVLRFISEFSAIIEHAIHVGASVTVDIAVEPKDRLASGSVCVLGWSPTALSAIAAARVRIEVSVY